MYILYLIHPTSLNLLGVIVVRALYISELVMKIYNVHVLTVIRRDGSVSKSGWPAGVRFPTGTSLVAIIMSIPTLGPTHPSIHWVSGVFSHGSKAVGA